MDLDLKAPKRNVIVRIMLDNKERYQLTEDIEILIQKGFDFNRRIDAASFGVCIDDADNEIPKGAEILIHHNASDPSYFIHDLSSEGKNVFSIPNDMCFVYRVNGGEWQPCKDFIISERIFQPYNGVIHGVEHNQLKKHLWVVKGNIEDAPTIENKAVFSGQHNDYEIIFHDKGREASLIRSRKRDIFAIDDSITEKVKLGELLVGKNHKDARIWQANLQT